MNGRGDTGCGRHSVNSVFEGSDFAGKRSGATRFLVLKAWVTLSVCAVLLSTFAVGESAQEIYKTKCAACHGKKGAADTMLGRNLGLRALGSDEVQKQSDDQLFAIISRGKTKKMPAYDNKLSRDQIRDLVKYVRSLKP